jgi:hypothetical protein
MNLRQLVQGKLEGETAVLGDNPLQSTCPPQIPLGTAVGRLQISTSTTLSVFVMKMTTLDDRETIVDTCMYRQNKHYLQALGHARLGFFEKDQTEKKHQLIPEIKER